MKLIVVFVLMLFVQLNARADSRTINVAKSGGDFSSLLEAMDSIIDASDRKRYVISVGPGVYFLNGQQLKTKPYVSLIGSGSRSTIIQSATASPGLDENCVVISIASDSSVENLTIRNYQSDPQSVHCGVNINDAKFNISALPRKSFGFHGDVLRNVQVLMKGNSKSTVGIFLENVGGAKFSDTSINIVTNEESNGIYSFSADSVFDRLSLNVSSKTGIGVLLDESSMTLNNADIYSTHIAASEAPGFFRMENVKLGGTISYVGSAENTFGFGAIFKNLTANGVFDFFNNSGVRVINSIFERGIANDPLGEQCNNVIDSSLSLLDC